MVKKIIHIMAKLLYIISKSIYKLILLPFIMIIGLIITDDFEEYIDLIKDFIGVR